MADGVGGPCGQSPLPHPPNSHVGILTPMVMVLGGRAFGELSHETTDLMGEIRALIKETQRAPLPLPPHEDTVRSSLARNQEVGPHQTLNMLVPRSWTPNREK